MKKILVVTGSPRKGGNSDMLADAFIEGAKEAGHEVAKFTTGDKDLRPCIHCDKCWTKETACVFEDGFSELAPLLESADELVLVSPLYWFTFTSQLKRAVDRLYAYCRPQCRRPLRISKAHLLTCGADTEEEVFAGIRSTFKSIAHFMKWETGVNRIFMELSAKGDAERGDNLETARKLGRSI